MKRTIIALTLASLASSGFAEDNKPADPKAAPASPVAAAAPAPVKAVASTSPYKVEIKSYRWRKHPKKNYERLVLEFTRKDSGSASAPLPNVVPAATGKEATVVVNSVALTGEQNEGKISDSYGSKSAFMGPLSILADASGNGFSIKLSFKKGDAVAEAMWLEAPARLVIDVFASAGDRNAIRSTAPDATDADEKVEKPALKTAEVPAKQEPVAEKKVLGTPNDAAKTVALSAGPTTPVAATPTTVAATTNEPRSIFATPAATQPKVKKSRRASLNQTLPLPPVAHEKNFDVASAPSPAKDDNYLCFPAAAQVGLSVFFSPKNRRTGMTAEEVRMDIQNTHNKVQAASAIVCYPQSAQVEASISYREDRPLITRNPDPASNREPASRK